MSETIHYSEENIQVTPNNEDTRIVENINNPTPKKALKTEDTGKIFEMAICLAYGI